MFEARTVFVLGAGASQEVGLPVGSGLLEQICKLIEIRFDYMSQKNGDFLIVDALKIMLNEGREVERLNAHIQAAHQVLRSAEQGLSIDNIVDALENEEVERVAKLGIVRAIQLAEGASRCFAKPSDHRKELDLVSFNKSWYDSFTKAICEKRRKSEVARIFDNISIVSFNYDRCIERYLPFSIANYYGISTQEVIDIMPSLKIVRPYGIAGLLPWMKGPPDKYQSENRLDALRLANASEMIRTFTQGVADEATSQLIRQEISRAERIVFLGFAFHPQNMKILEAEVNQRTEVLATAHSASDNDKAAIKDSILRTFGFRTDVNSSIVVAPETCSGLFKSYWRTITAPPSSARVQTH